MVGGILMCENKNKNNYSLELIIPIVLLILSNLGLYFSINLFVFKSWILWGLVLFLFNVIVAGATSVNDGPL